MRGAAGIVFLALLGLSQPADAQAGRQVLFVFENPITDTKEPPTHDQLTNAQASLDSLAKRISGLSIDGHRLSVAPDNIPADEIARADVVVQVITSASRPGLIVESYLFDRARSTWHNIDKSPMAHSSPTEMEAKLANTVLPPVIIHAFELANPARQVLLADCVFPNAKEARDHARMLSSTYGAGLRLRPKLAGKYNVVQLVPTAHQQFFEWWCIQLTDPRLGLVRVDTVTAYGFMERLGTDQSPEISVVLRRRDLIKNPPKTVVLDIQDRTTTVQQISEIFEELSNGM